jgi:hypothetical protein
VEDARIEHWLSSEGVKWEYLAAVPITAIDIEASKRNQARVNAPILDDLVERYTLAYIDGSEFPALIAYRADSGRLVLLDGNQRLTAAIDAERADVDVYLCSELNDERRTSICWTANGLNGDAGSALDRLLQAKAFHLRYPGLPKNEVARRFRIKRETFERELRGDEVGDRLRQFGLDPDVISLTNKDRLHSYIGSDVQFREAAKLIQEAGLKGGMAAEFWSDIRRARNEKDALAVIENWRARQDVQDLMRQKRFNRPHIPKSRMQQLLSRVDEIARFLQRYPDLVALEVAGHDEVLSLASKYKSLGPMVSGLVRQSAQVKAA